jgi:hypothetical protein
VIEVLYFLFSISILIHSDRHRIQTAANEMTMTPLFYLMTMSIDRFGIVKGGGGGVIEFIGLVWVIEL